MNLDRIITLAKALDLYDVEVRFAYAKNCDREGHKWCCQLNVSGGFVDYGPTPEAAAEALETCLRRKVEWKRDAALLVVKNFEVALELPGDGDPRI
jgi:hypothetical protein